MEKRKQPGQGNTLPSNLPFPVVGLGASAGGLQALLTFFENMPKDTGMAFVVVMHLAPDFESSADKILAKSTKMPVQQVTQTTQIEPNHVYLISPALHLMMQDGYLSVREREAGQPRHIAIDIFMRTLGDAHREHAVGIILSGSGSDGTIGMVRIKEQGGVTLAQVPEDAEYDSMPRSAIASGEVDFILPVADMPQKLLDLWENIRRIRLPADADVHAPIKPIGDPELAREAEVALRDIIVLLRTRTGHDFKHYKRATVLRRIERRLQVNRLSDLPSYRDFLQATPDETSSLLDDMLIGVTNFFRDREAFEALERDVIPQLLNFPPEGEGETSAVRVWSAGCSSGEEAYSLAMLLSDQVDYSGTNHKIQVFATDIDEHAIAMGRGGTYPESVVSDIPPARLRQYFSKEQNYYRVKKEIRERVLFALHNLLRDPPFSKLQLIVCRNLLIYLEREVQADILQMFHFALAPGGYLFLGSSESADVCSTLFTAVDKKNRIYRAKAVSNLVRPTTPLPFTNYTSMSVASVGEKKERRKVSFAEIHQRALEQYAPPSVVVNHESDIVHMSDRAGRFLRYVGGEPSHNLLSLVHPDLRLELRTALFQAIQTGKSIEARRVHFVNEGLNSYINMVARPFKDLDADFVLVLFDEVEETMSGEGKGPRDETKDSVLSQLEGELQRTKEQLQATIEQSETSTEELKASNEELQAINEELRSTTEELETSKEELQSINEELITVNQELKSKVEETGKINDDLQNLIASTDIATVFVDKRMRIKSYTPRATEIFSIISSDTGRSLLDITHRLDYPGMADDAAAAFESLRIIEREVPSKNGRWYIVRLLPYRTTENLIDGAVLTFIDITERREAEDRAREGEARLRLAAESTRDFIIITFDRAGNITSWNRGAERVFGYREDEVIGRSGDLILTEEDRQARVLKQEMERAERVGRAEDERWHLRKDGSRFFCSGVTTPLVNDGHHGFAKIGRDVTEKKRQEDEQENRLERTQVSSKLKDEFFAIMSHELKQPLNIIQLNADLIARLPVIQNQRVAGKAVDTIQNAVRSQARIIDDLLDLSRIRTGKLKLSTSPVLLQQHVNDVLEGLRGDAAARSIRLELTIPPVEQEPLVVTADPVRLAQIIGNLVSNAIKFSPDNSVVQVRVQREDARLRLDVQDQGPGISAEHLPKIFELFGQAPNRDSIHSRGGLGIGLALVRQLAEAHGGRAEASSPGLGQGATFSVWLPLCQDQPEEVNSEAPSGNQLAGKAILLVEDSREVCDVMQALLELEDARVTVAYDGHQALEIATETSFDLVLSDIGMPGMDGIQLIGELRKLPAFAATPIVALTGFGARNDVARVLEAGFDTYLVKPIAVDNLQQALKSLLGEDK
ncbi:CheR family methyltransferase [Pseudomonas mangiferae]|uniref:PAS domain S-box protein n=1 Tax=Pseudomonas mangiferae TaxID=2593654 RepID=A0A553GW29_9PSED|nr:CheR family methyltransferase [Pseudomonas mangiferae]TRX73721.1 PAS domain S-box protein [Pseudomonas mangiferae]